MVYYLVGDQFQGRFQTLQYGEVCIARQSLLDLKELQDLLNHVHRKSKGPIELRIGLGLPGLYQSILKIPRTLDPHFLEKPVLYLLKKEIPEFKPGDYWRWELLRTHLAGPGQTSQVLVQVFPSRLIKPWEALLNHWTWRQVEYFHFSAGLSQALGMVVPTPLPVLCVLLHPGAIGLCLQVEGTMHLFRQLACPMPEEGQIQVQAVLERLGGTEYPHDEGNQRTRAASRFEKGLPEDMPDSWRSFLGTLQTLLYRLPDSVLSSALLVVCGPEATRLPVVEAVARLIGKPALLPVPRLRAQSSQSLAPVAFLTLLGTGLLSAEPFQLRPYQPLSAS
ncbi:MAG: hypothetical protein D6715_07115 [Calditrichaeota bacterium]|nr:MAG: hypothetical protein D6715_07115 [Calditrichota bacterium]